MKKQVRLSSFIS